MVVVLVLVYILITSLACLPLSVVTVGTQAAVLAGLDITMFIEFQPPPTEAWQGNFLYIARFLKFMYYVMIVSAFCSNMMVVAHTTALSVLGAGLALRGPDGSMMTATDGLYEERQAVFAVFGVGLACTVGSVVLCVWLILHWEAAFVCMVVTIYTCRKIYTNYRRVMKRFDFDESETVDFHDIFAGPAAIRVMPSQPRFPQNNGALSMKRSKSEEEFMLPRHLGEPSTTNGKSNSPVLRRQSSYVLHKQQFGESSIQTV